MKKHTFLLTTAFISLLTTRNAAQDSALLHLVSDVASKGTAQISLHVDAAIEVAQWDHDYLKVEIQVTQSNLNLAQLKSLAATGFFKVETLGNAANLVLNMPDQLLPVQVNGMKPANEMTFKIAVPRYAPVTRYGELTDLLVGK